MVNASLQPQVDGSAGSQAKPTSIVIEIYSDTICPFCYLGYKKILAAIEKAKQEDLAVTFSIIFKPFILDPTLPVDHPVSKLDRYKAKFGEDRVESIISGMAERGKACGIDFSYGGPIRSTFLSHRLLEKAYKIGGEDMQRATVEALFSGYFENEKDIGDPDYLAQVGVNATVFVDKEQALDFLDSDELKGDVCAGVRKAQSLRISGVPFSVINGKYAVDGAQEPQAFLNVFRKIACGECPCKKSA